MDLETLALASGFDDAAEMMRLVAKADISTPERLDAFKRWQLLDGSKAGLLELDDEAKRAE